MKKNPLGRGLESLIPKDNTANKRKTFELDITDIVPNENQPRRIFDSDKLNELAESIKSKGLIQPIIVAKQGEKYVIIAGERRWRACGLAGLKKVPVVIKDVTDEKEKLELALIENIQREDLNPVEVAKAYKSLIEKFSYTQEELAKIVGKSRSAVANVLRLLNLPMEIINAVEKNIISEGHARALLGLKDKEKLVEVFKSVVAKKLSVRETETLVNRLNKGITSNDNGNKHVDVFIEAIEKEFEEFLKVKVNIKAKKKGGTIEIKYNSNEELDAIVNFIRGQS